MRRVLSGAGAGGIGWRAGAWSLSVALASLWLPLIWRWSQAWRVSPDQAFGWGVPLLAVYLFHQRWKKHAFCGWQGRPPERGAGATPAEAAAEEKRRFLPLPRGDAGADPGREADERAEAEPSGARSPANAAAGGSWGALAVMGVGVLLTAACLPVLEANSMWPTAQWWGAAGATLATLGGLAWLGGARWAMRFWFPPLFMFTALTWPTPVKTWIVENLSGANARFAAEVVSAAGHPAVVTGNVIVVSTGMVGIAEACSGMRSLQAVWMVAWFAGEFFLLNLPRRLFLVFASVCVAIVTNIARTVFLTWVAASAGLEASERWHDTAGNVEMAIGLAAVALLAWRAHRPRRERALRARPERAVRARGAGGGQGRPPESMGTAGPGTASAENKKEFAPLPRGGAGGGAVADDGAALDESVGGVGGRGAERSGVEGRGGGWARRVGWAAGVVVGVMVLAEAGTQRWYASHERAAVAGFVHWRLAAPGGGWTAVEVPAREREILGSSDARGLERPSGAAPAATVFLVNWEGDAARSENPEWHDPSICMPAAGARLTAELGVVAITIAGRQVSFTGYSFVADGQPIIVYFCHWDAETAEARTELIGAADDVRARRWQRVADGRREGDVAHIAFLVATANAPEALDWVRHWAPVLLHPVTG